MSGVYLSVNYCSNCKSIVQSFMLEVDNQPLYLGVLACPVCHIINLSGEFADKIATAIRERHIED